MKQQKRQQAGKTIKNVVQRIWTDNEKWLEVIFHVVRFLTANGLPFRGDDECLDFDGRLSGGLNLNTLQHLVFEMQPDLATLAKKMRRNAKYLSSDVQNEIIEIVATLVREKHALRICKSELYTIMADGTTDKNHEEIQGIVIHFIDVNSCENRGKSIKCRQLW